MSNLMPMAVHVIFKKNNKVFLIRRNNTGFLDNYWSIPAGRVENGESGINAMVRESKEEVGAIIEENNLSAPLIMHHHDERGERIYLFFLCTNWKGELKNREEDKCDAVGWYEIGGFPEKMVEHIKKAIELMGKGCTYYEYGF